MEDDERLAEIGRRVKKIRRSRELSQFRFAESLGVSNITVSRIENGATAMNILLLIKISNVLEVQVEDILRGEVTMIDMEEKKVTVH